MRSRPYCYSRRIKLLLMEGDTHSNEELPLLILPKDQVVIAATDSVAVLWDTFVSQFFLPTSTLYYGSPYIF